MKISRNNPMIERIERKNKKENLNEEIKIKDEAIIEVPIISAIALKDIEKTKEIVKNNLEEKEEQVEEFVKEQEKKVEEAKKESKKPLTEDYLNENFKDRWTLNEQEYTVKCTGRKELRQLIAEAKISDIKYTFVRLDKQPNFIDEGYKYDFKYSLANGLEKINEEVETNLNDLTIEELFKKVVDKDLIVFDEEGHFTEEASKHYNDVAKVYGEDKLDKLCSEEHCFKEETKESLKESLSEESKKAFDDLLSYARELYKRDKKTNKEVTTKEVIEEVINNADPKEIYALAYSYTDVITIQNMIKDKLSKDLEDALEDYIEKEDEEDDIDESVLSESQDEKDKEESLKEALNVIGKLRDYAPSKEAEPLWNVIKEKDLVREFENLISDLYIDGATVEELNNLLGFKQEFVKGMLDIEDEEVVEEEPIEEVNVDEVEEETTDEDETMLDDEFIDEVAKNERDFVPEREEDEVSDEEVKLNREKFLNDETGYTEDDLSMLDAIVNDEEEE